MKITRAELRPVRVSERTHHDRGKATVWTVVTLVSPDNEFAVKAIIPDRRFHDFRLAKRYRVTIEEEESVK